LIDLHAKVSIVDIKRDLAGAVQRVMDEHGVADINLPAPPN